jgi:hypothetical protein
MSQPTQKTPLVPRGSDHPDNLDRVRNQVDEIKVVMKDNINRYVSFHSVCHPPPSSANGP